MRRLPRAADASLFDSALLLRSGVQGLTLLAIVLVIFAVTLHSDHGAEHARAFTFTVLIIASFGLIFANRSWSRSLRAAFRTANAALWWVIAGGLTFLVLALNVPLLREVFRFA